jgi:AraC family transcriptional regulator
MDLLKHGHDKFPQARLLCSSKPLGWRGIAAELRSHPSGDLPPFESNQIEVTVATSGVCDATVSRKGWGLRQKTRVDPGTLWISPVAVAEDDIRISAPLPEILHIYLSPDRFTAFSDVPGLHKASPGAVRYLAGLYDPLILQVGTTLLEEMRNPSAAGKLLADALALSLAARLVQRYSDSGARERPLARMERDELRVRRAIDFMHAHMQHDIGLDDVAAAVAVSPYHFARMFRAATGIPPHRYLANLRIERAKILLSQGLMPLAEIGLEMQFSTQANFTRAFKKATGRTPAEYRRMG